MSRLEIEIYSPDDIDTHLSNLNGKHENIDFLDLYVKGNFFLDSLSKLFNKYLYVDKVSLWWFDNQKNLIDVRNFILNSSFTWLEIHNSHIDFTKLCIDALLQRDVPVRHFCVDNLYLSKSDYSSLCDYISRNTALRSIFLTRSYNVSPLFHLNFEIILEIITSKDNLECVALTRFTDIDAFLTKSTRKKILMLKYCEFNIESLTQFLRNNQLKKLFIRNLSTEEIVSNFLSSIFFFTNSWLII